MIQNRKLDAGTIINAVNIFARESFEMFKVDAINRRYRGI